MKTETLEQFVLGYLDDRGMVEKTAHTILELVKGREEMSSVNWGGDKDGYPVVFHIALSLVINVVALKWIDDNLPLAWYRPLFEK